MSENQNVQKSKCPKIKMSKNQNVQNPKCPKIKMSEIKVSNK
jgi:hypothetical protein